MAENYSPAQNKQSNALEVREKYVEEKFGAPCEGLVRNFSQRGKEITLNLLEGILDFEQAEKKSSKP